MARQKLDSLPSDIGAWVEGLFDTSNLGLTLQSGGINNKVYLLEAGKERVILKMYAAPPAGQPDRFQAEADFLSYANKVANGYVPELIQVSQHRRLVLMEFVPGSIYATDFQPGKIEVARAAEFIKALNADLDAAKAGIRSQATEGYLSLTDHASNVDQRIRELAASHLPAAYQSTAKSLIKIVKDDWDAAQDTLESVLDEGTVTDSLDQSYLCVSPSDFGFHNAVPNGTTPVFIDFEFSGWDDPCKLVTDFFLQPRIPVPTSFKTLMEEAVAPIIPLDILRPRSQLLQAVLRVKWMTIVLAVLRPARFESMLENTGDQAANELIIERFARAYRIIDGENGGLS